MARKSKLTRYENPEHPQLIATKALAWEHPTHETKALWKWRLGKVALAHAAANVYDELHTIIAGAKPLNIGIQHSVA